MTTLGAAVIATQPPSLAAAPFKTANPPGGNLTGHRSPDAPVPFFRDCESLIANTSDPQRGWQNSVPRKTATSFTPTARDHLCRAYCCAGQATQHNGDQQIIQHGGLSMYEAIKQSAFEIIFVVVGIVLASSLPLAVVFFYLAMN